MNQTNKVYQKKYKINLNYFLILWSNIKPDITRPIFCSLEIQHYHKRRLSLCSTVCWLPLIFSPELKIAASQILWEDALACLGKALHPLEWSLHWCTCLRKKNQPLIVNSWNHIYCVNITITNQHQRQDREQPWRHPTLSRVYREASWLRHLHLEAQVWTSQLCLQWGLEISHSLLCHNLHPIPGLGFLWQSRRLPDEEKARVL